MTNNLIELLLQADVMTMNEAYSTVVQSHQQAPSNKDVPEYEIIGSSTIDTNANECYSTAGIELES